MVVDGLATALKWVAVAVLIVVAIVTVIDIVARRAAGQPLPGVLEFTEVVGMVVIVYGGLATANHITVEELVAKLGRRSQAIVRALTSLVVVGTFAIAAWVSFGAFERSYTREEYATGLVSIPLYPSRLIVALGFAVAAARVLVTALERIRFSTGAEQC
ncbi:TRAP-type C4-dicarboxylate transport system, small permease component Up/Down [Blastococcus saxobsidens DD2]|uniref:TRAP-type C4-dicarboxylate transport system, small permease component Up/Down n=2 Tax=Blastococcus saxobsidens TaxID=138336 RepID=H6RNL6_BLASD|nr:TRAP-type C4-dicarboxylate transport system, small permease component Up/Down [Blastococcus saxobsidens DD2]